MELNSNFIKNNGIKFKLYQEQWNYIQTISRTMEWGRVVLTDDAVKYFPVRGIENPVRLTCGEDERSCKPVMIEHLENVKKNPIRIEFFLDLSLRTDKGQVEPNRRSWLQIWKRFVFVFESLDVL